jgi:hypothetical protein
MPTVIKLASHAYHYLTIFDNDTGRALHLARTRRIASADQRIVLLGQGPRLHLARLYGGRGPLSGP